MPVDERRYLALSEFWIQHCGNHEGGRTWGNFDGSYAQDENPVSQQEEIEAHAVRATLLCRGLVNAATVNAREDYLCSAKRL